MLKEIAASLPAATPTAVAITAVPSLLFITQAFYPAANLLSTIIQYY
jgi:hypothetical protein